MSNMRIVKYETLIEDINSNITKRQRATGFFSAIAAKFNSTGNTALALIYDYDKCNEYAKVIMNKSELVLDDLDEINIVFDYWMEVYPTFEKFKDPKRKIEASKKLVQLCRNELNATEGYKFIFWALMILTVDKTDAEEHLALICDFAKMLRITEDEFEDIIQIIKIIYNEVTSEYLFKSENIPSIFGSLLNIYAGQVID